MENKLPEKKIFILKDGTGHSRFIGKACLWCGVEEGMLHESGCRKLEEALKTDGWNACYDAFTPHITRLTQERDKLTLRLQDSKEHIDALLKRVGELEGLDGLDRDKAYAEFTSHQRPHDCPGFDCAICSECFEAICARFSAPGQLVGLGVDILTDFILENNVNLVEPLCGTEAKSLAYFICQRFGVPKVPTVNEIDIALNERDPMGTRLHEYPSKKIAQAIHNLLDKGESHAE